MIKNEKGEVVVEASIVLTITIVFITVLIYLGFYIYQYTNLQVVANHTATNVAQVYASEYKDPVYGYISESEFYKTNLYRNLTNIFTKSLDETNEKKAEWFSLYRLKKASMIKTSEPKVEVDIVQKPGKIIQKQIVVTIKQEMSLPLSSFWGSKSKSTVTVVGRADCLDLLEYFNMVDTVNGIYEKFDEKFDVIGAIDKWITFYNNVKS